MLASLSLARVARWGIALVAVLLLDGAGILGYARWIANPRVAEEIRTNPDGEMAQRVMLLSLPSGREVPVNYLREDSLVFVGADGPWWRELRGEGGVPIEITLRGETLAGHAQVVLDEPEYRADVFARLRPTAPLIFGKLIVITVGD